MLCKVHNPTRGRRIIYDGLSNRKIEIDAGATKTVDLAPQVAAAYGSGSDGDNSDLHVTAVNPPPPKQQYVAPPVAMKPKEREKLRLP